MLRILQSRKMKDKIGTCKVCGDVRTIRCGICHKCRYARRKEEIRAYNLSRSPYRNKVDISKCDVCSIKKEEITCKEGIHVHHKDNDRTNNKPENLQPVCPSCHAKIHNTKEKLDHAFSRNSRMVFKDGRWQGNKTKVPCKYCGTMTGEHRAACLKCYDAIRIQAGKERIWPGKMKLLNEKQRKDILKRTWRKDFAFDGKND